MASTMLLNLPNLWPFSILKPDDLRLSKLLVRRLSIPEQTKQFVFAVREPESNSVVYILAVQNLSEQSAADAECLIKEVKPKAVVAQVTSQALTEIQIEEKASSDDQLNNIPTSSLEVLKRCLIDKINKEHYDKLAGCQVLKEIFGVGFYGHFFAAKRAAAEVDSHFLLLESPYESVCIRQTTDAAATGDQSSGLHFQPSCLVSGRGMPSVLSSRRICLPDTFQSEMVKLLVPSLDLLLQHKSFSDSVSDANQCENQPACDNYEAPPPFAQSVYPLLADLYAIFNDLPPIRKALASAQEMLANINRGNAVDATLLSEVHSFRIAIEALRVALNNAAHCPTSKMKNAKSEGRMEFSELPSDEKCHALLAHSLRSQARKFGGPIVAIVDAGKLAGLRRQWKTTLPPEVEDLADQCYIHHYFGDYLGDDDEDDEDTLGEQHTGKKRLLADKPVVAVGAGATAVIGATSLSKAFPASTLVKITTYKVPAFLKIGLTNFQRQAYIGLSKFIGSSKFLAPGVASSGTNASATLKLTASAEKIRAVTHSVIGYAERTSLLAVRTSFYEIMRRRKVRSFRLAPWTAFSCSVAACSGLLIYGDGIECVAESFPSVPSIASLGRGLQSLHQTSQEVSQTSSVRIKEALQSLMYNLKRK